MGDVRATGWCSGPGRGGNLIIASLRGASRWLGFFVLPCYNTIVVRPHRLAAQDNTLSRCRSRVRIPLGVPPIVRVFRNYSDGLQKVVYRYSKSSLIPLD